MLGFLLPLFASVTAFFFGYSLWKAIEMMRSKAAYRSSLLNSKNKSRFDSLPLHVRIIRLIEQEEKRLKQGIKTPFAFENLPNAKRFNETAKIAGVDETISFQAFMATRIKVAILGALIGLAVGFLFSPAFAFLLAIVGGYLAWRTVGQSLSKQADARVQEAERHIPEMLDVVALGMRSGLSFDTSLELYSEHFNTMLAHELSIARDKWTTGFERREDALRKVASSYDSLIFTRITETIIRSIRFGSSMVESLEADAREARQTYRMRKEEKIAKAPVKMMIPTGVMILPAMLLMVMGPVLLELIGGGI